MVICSKSSVPIGVFLLVMMDVTGSCMLQHGTCYNPEIVMVAAAVIFLWYIAAARSAGFIAFTT